MVVEDWGGLQEEGEVLEEEVVEVVVVKEDWGGFGGGGRGSG